MTESSAQFTIEELQRLGELLMRHDSEDAAERQQLATRIDQLVALEAREVADRLLESDGGTGPSGVGRHFSDADLQQILTAMRA